MSKRRTTELNDPNKSSTPNPKTIYLRDIHNGFEPMLAQSHIVRVRTPSRPNGDGSSQDRIDQFMRTDIGWKPGRTTPGCTGTDTLPATTIRSGWGIRVADHSTGRPHSSPVYRLLYPANALRCLCIHPMPHHSPGTQGGTTVPGFPY